MPWATRAARRKEALRKNLVDAAGQQSPEDKARAGENAAYVRQTDKADNVDAKDAQGAQGVAKLANDAMASSEAVERYGAPEASEAPPKPQRTDVDDVVDRLPDNDGEKVTTNAVADLDESMERESKEDEAAGREHANKGTVLAGLEQKYPRAFALWEKSGGGENDRAFAFVAFLKSLGIDDVPEIEVKPIVGG